MSCRYRSACLRPQMSPGAMFSSAFTMCKKLQLQSLGWIIDFLQASESGLTSERERERERKWDEMRTYWLGDSAVQIQLKCRLYLVLKTPEHLEHRWPSLFSSRPLIVGVKSFWLAVQLSDSKYPWFHPSSLSVPFLPPPLATILDKTDSPCVWKW